MKYFHGKLAFVTGAGSGIGKAICEELAKFGTKIAAVDINPDSCEKIVANIKENGGDAKAWSCDVSDYDALKKVISEVYETYGKIDLLFNNAGIGMAGEARGFSIEDWRRITAVNIDGVINGVQIVYPKMIEDGGGHIINTASLAGLIPSSDIVAYSATKYAVVGLSNALRPEAAKYNVAVSVVCPGFIDTEISRNSKYINVPEELVTETWKSLPKMNPNKFAVAMLKQVAKNKMTIVIPFSARMIWRGFRFVPAFMGRFATFVSDKVKAKAGNQGLDSKKDTAKVE